MKPILFLFIIILFWSCSEEEQLQPIEKPWTITWETESHTAEGTLYFTSKNEIKIEVEKPDQFFFNERAVVFYTFKKSNDKFIITRNDNQFTMSYEIMNETASSYVLKYEDDLIVNISQ